MDSLKEYSIGVAVFDKDPSFDPRIDNNVRTEARRLRAKLEEYYGTIGQSDPVRIELPKGSYTPSFVAVQPRAEKAIAVEKPPSGKWSALHSKWLLLSAILLAAAVGGLTWYRTEFVRASGTPRSIAVLPFLNLSAGEGSEFFTDRLTAAPLSPAELVTLKGAGLANDAASVRVDNQRNGECASRSYARSN